MVLLDPAVHPDPRVLKVSKDSRGLRDQRARKDLLEHPDNKALPDTLDLLVRLVLRGPVVTLVLQGLRVVQAQPGHWGL